MKRFIYILFFFFATQSLLAQDEQGGEGKIREKMIQYIQNKLGLSRVEAEKFQPVFLNYLKELRQTNRESKSKGETGLDLQQKVVDIRVRYRDQFKPIIGEKRSNEVFDHERDFIKSVREEINDRRQERPERRADKGKNSKLFSN
ncbi:MAG TPA: hypothetical protein VF609_16090 [Flavisolibacter sp.]|jgi:hypothetical protein